MDYHQEMHFYLMGVGADDKSIAAEIRGRSLEYYKAVKSELVALKKKNEQLEDMKRDWDAANSSGGWIDNLRTRAEAAETKLGEMGKLQRWSLENHLGRMVQHTHDNQYGKWVEYSKLRAILDAKKVGDQAEMPTCNFEGCGKPSVHVNMSLKNGVYARCKEHDGRGDQ